MTCPYKKRCGGYDETFPTCKNSCDVDLRYCGKYRGFEDSKYGGGE